MSVLERLERIFAAADAADGIEHMMRSEERRCGHRVVVPGEVPWLPLADWDPSAVVSIDGSRARLVAILARNPGNGALRRLIAAIEVAGLIPCIIEPTRELQATLKRWGWRSRRAGAGENEELRWYPRHNPKVVE